MFTTFEGHDKKRLNSIFDLYGVTYEDYEKREKKMKGGEGGVWASKVTPGHRRKF